MNLSQRFDVIHRDAAKVIKEKYTVKSIVNSLECDNNPNFLDNELSNFANYIFKNNETILIFYQDTGFYNELKHGTSFFMTNLVEALLRFGIPAEHVILLTNHYGIQKELDCLEQRTGYKFIKVVETSLWYDFPNDEDFQVNNTEKSIKYLYSCFNNIPRCHRYYTLSQLKENNLLDHGMVSHRFKQ